jgi:hypothetical protein
MPSCHFVHLILLSSGPKVPKSGPFKNEGIHEWYHRLLQGAVAQCIAIEERYKDQLPEIQLGTAISKASVRRHFGVRIQFL